MKWLNFKEYFSLCSQTATVIWYDIGMESNTHKIVGSVWVEIHSTIFWNMNDHDCPSTETGNSCNLSNNEHEACDSVESLIRIIFSTVHIYVFPGTHK